MDGPTAADLALDPRLKTLTAKFLDQRRREKRRNNGKSFVGSERIDTLTDSRKRFDAFRQDRTNIQRFKLASRHSDYSSQLLRRSPASATSITDQISAIAINQVPA